MASTQSNGRNKRKGIQVHYIISDCWSPSSNAGFSGPFVSSSSPFVGPPAWYIAPLYHSAVPLYGTLLRWTVRRSPCMVHWFVWPFVGHPVWYIASLDRLSVLLYGTLLHFTVRLSLYGTLLHFTVRRSPCMVHFSSLPFGGPSVWYIAPFYRSAVPLHGTLLRWTVSQCVCPMKPGNRDQLFGTRNVVLAAHTCLD